MSRDLPQRSCLVSRYIHGLMEASAPAPKRRKLAEDEVEHSVIGGESEIGGLTSLVHTISAQTLLGLKYIDFNLSIISVHPNFFCHPRAPILNSRYEYEHSAASQQYRPLQVVCPEAKIDRWCLSRR